MTTNALSRPLRALVGLVLAAGLLVQPGLAAADDTSETTTFTHISGVTVTYAPRAEPGKPLRITGTGWLAKPDRVEEGEKGSVIGIKLIDDDLGQLQRKSLIENPRLGVPIQNNTVWGAVWADDEGNFELELDWPGAGNAVVDPAWKAGASFNLQLLSGTLYSDQPGVDPNERPDVSRTMALRITVAGDPVPEEPTDPVDPEPEPEPEPEEPVDPTPDTESVSVTTCLTAYGPREKDKGAKFCFRAPEKVVVGKPIVLKGVSGYLATDDKTGSVVNFLLDAEKSGDPNTVFSTRTLTNPATGKKIADKRSHAVVQARPDGTWTATIPWPTTKNTTLTQAEIDKRFAVGTQHSIRILTGSLLTDPADRQRGGSHYFAVVKSLSDEVDIEKPPAEEEPEVPTVPTGATCKAKPADYTYQLAPGMKSPAANIGGTIRLRGTKWCNLVGGGSLIAVKINAGGVAHLPTATAAHYDANRGREVGTSPTTIAKTNKTIWYVIEADKSGSFDVEIPLPTRKNSDPVFTEGAYTLQLLTRTLSADPYYKGKRPDPSRSIATPEFTVVAEGKKLTGVTPGKPIASPDPLHATDDLPASKRGGVKVVHGKKEWIVTVPKAKKGDWVYLNVFDGDSPRFPWEQKWFKVGAGKKVTASVASLTLPTGTNKLSVQDRNGKVLGWTTVTVAAPKTGGTAQPTPRPARSVTTTKKAGATKPAKAAVAPVAAYADLTDANAGMLPSKADKGTLTLSVPKVPGGDWVSLFLYTEGGKVAPTDWVQVGSDHILTAKFGTLPNGSHKLAVVDAKGALVGWVAVEGPAPLVQPVTAVDPVTPSVAPVVQAPAETPLITPIAAPADPTWTLVLVGLAVLVLAGSATGVVLLRTPVRP